MTKGIMDDKDLELIQIPTPDQIPEKIDLSHLPEKILRSGAVETLARQNEDLMARLGVTLRRLSQLEAEMSELQSENLRLENRTQVYQDQALVLQEKNRIIAEKFLSYESDAKESQQRLMMLETQFAELYSTSQERLRNLQNQLELTQKHRDRLLRYRHRVKRVFQNLERNFQIQAARMKKEEATNRELSQKLGDAGLRIQTMAKEYTTHQTQLVENYESQIKLLREKNSNLETENVAYAERTSKFDEIYDKKVEFENLLIKERRQNDEYRKNREFELANLQSDLAEYKASQKAKLIELETSRRERNELQDESRRLALDLAATKDQVETLQLLWQDNQREIEKLKNKNSALQSLNQQLSMQMQNQRIEIQQLRSEIQNSDQSTANRIQQIKSHLAMLQSPELNFVESERKINTLIAEIQSGFRAQSSNSEGAAASIEPSISIKSEVANDSLGNGATSNP